MTWTRLDDSFFDREDVLSLDRDARLLHIEALVWSNHAGSDGRIPRGALRKLTDHPDVSAAIALLEEIGLWTPTSTGWQLDWKRERQEPAADVETRAEYTRQRQARRRKHLAGDHSECNPKYCHALKSSDVTRDATGDVTRDATQDVTTTRPVPSRPGPKEPGRGRGKKRAFAAEHCVNGAPVVADGSCCGEEHGRPVSVEAIA